MHWKLQKCQAVSFSPFDSFLNVVRLKKCGIITEKPCRLANGAVIAPYVFESCAKLSQIHLPQVCAMTDIVTPSSPPGGLSHGSFHSAGIRCVTLGEETIFLGHRAFENCKQLSQVDISSTKLDHLHMHTFSHCQSLQKEKSEQKPLWGALP